MTTDRLDLWTGSYKAVTSHYMVFSKKEKCSDNFPHRYYGNLIRQLLSIQEVSKSNPILWPINFSSVKASDLFILDLELGVLIREIYLNIALY